MPKLKTAMKLLHYHVLALSASSMLIGTLRSTPHANERLIAMTQAGDLEGVQKALDDGASPSYRDPQGANAFIYSTLAGYTDITRLLLGDNVHVTHIDSTNPEAQTIVDMVHRSHIQHIYPEIQFPQNSDNYSTTLIYFTDRSLANKLSNLGVTFDKHSCRYFFPCLYSTYRNYTNGLIHVRINSSHYVTALFLGNALHKNKTYKHFMLTWAANREDPHLLLTLLAQEHYTYNDLEALKGTIRWWGIIDVMFEHRMLIKYILEIAGARTPEQCNARYHNENFQYFLAKQSLAFQVHCANFVIKHAERVSKPRSLVEQARAVIQKQLKL
jgi:hypothetical protein